ncbi:nucleoside diphosphate kinase regulator [Pikeienuella sp. HZG-20]|uniref:nucleoside diphosphate kinase regulator n=1 Tax=Paludibacillus litoralis TaxID=3133267 RepID=UPI0030EE4C61
MKTTTAPKSTKRRGKGPRIVLDAALADRFESMALAAAARTPEISERFLEELGRARIVPTAKLPANVVTIGNFVTFRDETSGEERTVSLVFPKDANIEEGRISLMTPIGVALLGLAEGASFFWATRSGEERNLTVVSVQPAPSRVPTD